ncbi:probable sugar phosphate/phosphate translocator At1g06470 isoform X2 [Ananas comosus]|uniref:Probable sugar phosphate/phosphate translocator At1g06470 isoform X2 n=1 Tax=Ananas comosus TaxID=4615 RepID=A0A6P5FX27_ANACO|nr:probable sugar phosphate/phosphate translocator At1g06470 isoform X2 [Ananas comosus]
MGEADLGTEERGGEEEEAAAAMEAEEEEEEKSPMKKDPSFSQWCGGGGGGEEEEVGIGGNSAAESAEAPLIHGEGTPRSNYFRQRSLAHSEGNARGRRVVSFDVEGGLHTSDSMAKLESLEHTGHSSLSAATLLKTLFFIFVWYNKTLLGEKLGKFPAPLLMNTFHFTLQAVLSKIILCFQSRGPDNGVKMSWKDYFIRVVPTAIGTALDINLSNASLVFISVTFATMCKSASPIFLLLFAFAFRLENPSFKLLGIIIIISLGVLLTVAKETEFEFWGFVFVMLAAVMSGFRWSMTQILLQKEAYGLKDPITLMSYVTPMMAVATLILSLAMDPWHDFETTVYFDSPWHIVRSCLLMLIGGALAFFMVLTEYILVSATSAVTVTIAGVVKEAVTILVAVFYFHDRFTLLKGLGLLTIMFGVSLFNWYKYQKLKKGQPMENEEMLPVFSNGATKYVILDELDDQEDDS